RRPVAETLECDRGRAEERPAERGVAEERHRPFALRELRLPTESPPEALGDVAHGDDLRARDVQNPRRRMRAAEAAEGVRIRIALPDHVGVADREVEGLSGEDLAGDVDEHAVTQVHRVEEPEDEDARPPLPRVVLEDALAAEAALRVLAHGPGGVRLARASARRSHQRIDVAGGEDDE